MLPLSERVMDWVEARLQGITTANGFETNIGLNVSRARRTFDKAALPAVTIFETAAPPSDGAASESSASYTVAQSFVVIAHVIAEQATTGRKLGLARADIKRALMQPDDEGRYGISDVDGKIGALAFAGSDANPRQDGAVSESCAVSFVAIYQEGYGDPYRAR